MKNVLVVITTGFVPYGGLTTVAMNYYRHIDKNKIHMDFASTNTIPYVLKEELSENGSCYYQLPKRAHLPLYYNALKKICKNYDVVHIHANSATATIELLAASAAKTSKKVVHIHNTTCKHIIIHRVLKPLFDKCYTDAVACSEKAGEWIFKNNEFTVLNNAVDLAKYKFEQEDRLKIRKMYGIDENQIVVGHVGKINEQKNHSFMIDVFRKFVSFNPQAVLMLVGDGPLRKNIEDKVKEHNLVDNVVFCGMQNSAAPYYSAFDCILFPSLWEGLPLSLVEAQASGLTCVAADTITPEVDMGGVVQLSLNDQVDKWDGAIETAIKKDRKEQVAALRQNIIKKGFDIDDNAKKLEELYLVV